jgi:hypothetical protein
MAHTSHPVNLAQNLDRILRTIAHLISGFQNSHPQYDGFDTLFEAPMSFREKHRFLDNIYNSYPDPDLISAKNLENISRR